MAKREVIAVMALLTGGLLSTTALTLPAGLVLLAGGGYLLALPYLDGQRVGRSGAAGRRT